MSDVEQLARASRGEPQADGDDLSTVLRRLTDPGTGTRKTAVARARLANDDVTRELLDAGLRLLDGECGGVPARPPATEGPQSRFFEFLSVATVTAEATRSSGTPVTPAHQRDRWPRQGDYVADLLAYALSQHQWDGHLSSSGEMIDGLDVGAGLEAVVRDVAAVNCFGAELTVTYRLSQVAATLARSRPELRAVLTGSYDHLDATWGALYLELLARLGLRLRAGVALLDLTRALMALAEGVNLRLAALGDEDDAPFASGAALLTAGALALARQCFEPDPRGPTDRPGTPDARDASRAAGRPAPQGVDLSAVLLRLTHPGTGSRKTARSRARLANDAVTRQLLEAGLRLLDAEFRGERRTLPTGRAQPSRFFDFLSAVQVSAEVRTAGRLRATPAHLRDRWPRHDHFVDDLVSYAVSPQQGTFAPPGVQRAARALAGSADLQSAGREVTYEVLMTAQQAPSARLRMVAATLAEGRPQVRTALRETYERQELAWAGFYQQVLVRFGLRLRDDVPMRVLVRALMAMTEGMIVRLLSAGEQGLVDRSSHESLYGRMAVVLLRGCTEPVTDPGA